MNHLDENLERLISRCLDGEASADERRDFDARLANDADFRRVVALIRRIDDEARSALRGNLVPPMVTAVATRPRRGTWLATAAGVMAAAATIGLFVFPAARNVSPVDQFTHHRPRPIEFANGPRNLPESTLVADRGVSRPESWQMLTPHRDVVDIQQKWVIVLDPETQRVYLVNLDQYGAATVPVHYEH